jgi:DNA helicase-2/ATP-dependent DNA helicase PcrA
MQPSPQQQSILQFIARESRNLMVSAAAGAGKTTTLRLICEALPESLRAVALAFNKSTEEQFRAKLPKRVLCKTIHALGFQILREHTSSIRTDTYKVDSVIQSVLGDSAFGSGASIKRVVSGLRSQCWVGGPAPLSVDLSDDILDADTLLAYSIRVLDQCRKQRNIIDFDDMIDHVVHHELRSNSGFDIILGDEVQDWTPQQIQFVRMLAGMGKPDFIPSEGIDPELLELMGMTAGTSILAPTSRVVFVGDRNQAIYGWRGAACDSIDRLIKEFDCVESPLSVSFRCSQAVTRCAQEDVGVEAIQHRDGAPEGAVEHVRIGDEHESLVDFLDTLDPNNTLFLCRNNAPLLSVACQLVAEGRRFCMEGQDIAAGLRKVAAHLAKRCSSLEDFPSRAFAWAEDEVLKRRRSPQSANDIASCLVAVARSGAVSNTHAIEPFLRRVFDGPAGGLRLSSVHRAKGLEAETAVIYRPQLIPSPWVKEPDLRKQEKNVLYVAKTRAINRLIFLTDSDD